MTIKIQKIEITNHELVVDFSELKKILETHFNIELPKYIHLKGEPVGGQCAIDWDRDHDGGGFGCVDDRPTGLILTWETWKNNV